MVIFNSASLKGVRFLNKAIVATKDAPPAGGPYSQAVKYGNFVFTSGMGPQDPVSGSTPTDVEGQAKQALENLKAVLIEAGSGMDKIIKTTIFLKDMNDFAAINAIYASYFSGDYPSRSCIEVARLPKDILFEIECVAVCE